MTAVRYELFDTRTNEAISRLHDSTFTVACKIVRGEVPPRMKLQHAVFPPEGIDRNLVPARYVFKLLDGDIHAEIELMAFWYCTSGDESEYTLIGFATHPQRESWYKHINFKAPIELQYVAVKYRPYAREGEIFMDRELYHLYEILESMAVLRARERALEELARSKAARTPVTYQRPVRRS